MNKHIQQRFTRMGGLAALAIASVLGSNASASEIQLLMVEQDQLLVHMPDQHLIVHGNGINEGNLSHYILNAWGTNPLDGSTAGHSGLTPPGNEASTGTGNPAPMPMPPREPDGTDPISTNEAAQGSGIVVAQSDWGLAEVLFHCENADVVLYQNIDGELVEFASMNVATEQCL